MQELTAYEKETIINYNAAEKVASIYTHDRSLIRKLMDLAKTREDIVIEYGNEDCASFIAPKKWKNIAYKKDTGKLDIYEDFWILL